MIESSGGRFGGSVKRMEHYDAHKAYGAMTADPTSPNYIQKLAVGPIESEDGRFMIGSILIVEATYEEALKFNTNDPFSIHKVWDQVSSV
jgi:uncharacterized protein YciI